MVHSKNNKKTKWQLVGLAKEDRYWSVNQLWDVNRN